MSRGPASTCRPWLPCRQKSSSPAQSKVGATGCVNTIRRVSSAESWFLQGRKGPYHVRRFMRLRPMPGKGDDHNIIRVAGGEPFEALSDRRDRRLFILKQRGLAAKCVGEYRLQCSRVTGCASEPIALRIVVSVFTDIKLLACNAV